MSLENLKTISFEEIVKDRDATVRVTEDNLIYAVDLVMVITGKDRDQAGMVLRRLPEGCFHAINWIERQLSTHGGPKTKLVSFKHAIELIMVLPGKMAKEIRSKFADIIHRHIAEEEGDSPVHELARNTLMSGEELVRKRKREDLEFEKMEAEVIRFKAEAVGLEHANRLKNVQINKEIADNYISISTNPHIDERARLIFKDNFLNLATQGRLSITNGSSQGMPADVKPISISLVASEMGYKASSNELISVGHEVKKQYVIRNGRDPPKHDQLCNGRVTKVNSYTEADRDIIEDVLRNKFGDADF